MLSDADLIKLRRELRRRGKMLLSCEASADLVQRHRKGLIDDEVNSSTKLCPAKWRD